MKTEQPKITTLNSPRDENKNHFKNIISDSEFSEIDQKQQIQHIMALNERNTNTKSQKPDLIQ